MPENLSDRLAAALEIAENAGRLIMRYFDGQDFEIDTKRDGSHVTTADREAEKLIRAAIDASFPTDGFLGEETGETTGTSGYRWIVDPIDGTASFVHGVPLFGTLIGITHHDAPAAGVLRMPALDEVAWGGTGLGAWWQSGDDEVREARVSRLNTLKDSMVIMTSYDYFKRAGIASLYTAVAEHCGSSRGWSDCYGSLLVATGRAEACVEPVMQPWDIAAIMPIVREAGGRVSSFRGDDRGIPRHAVISNGRVHDDLVTICKQYATDSSEKA